MKRKYVRKNRFARQDASQQPLKTQQNQYEVFPGAVFDKDIFQHLSKDSGNLNTEGRRQYYHSITLFPLDTKEKKNRYDIISIQSCKTVSVLRWRKR